MTARRGVMLPVTAPAPVLLDLARQAEAAGVDEVWVAEDLGLHGGFALAGAILARTSRVQVGLGIAPAAARNPSFLAMEAVTLAQLYPARFRLGIGHGMPDWMRSIGAWPASPLTRLEETLIAVRRLLAGERVDLDGREVDLAGVELKHAPVHIPLFAGVRGPRSLAVAGRVADGLVLAGWSGPAYIRHARTVAEEAGGRNLEVVASARFALEEASDVVSAAERVTADLGRAGSSIRDMLVDDGAARTDGHDRIRGVGIAGDVGELRRGITRWDDAGSDVVLLDPLSVADLEAALDLGVIDPGLRD